MLFICYPTWTTCKKARDWLDKNNITYNERNIKIDNPSAEEIATWHKESGLPLKKFFNSSGTKYKELGLSKKLVDMSEKEQIDILATDGMLVKRPILVDNNRIIVGYKAENWADFFANASID